MECNQTIELIMEVARDWRFFMLIVSFWIYNEDIKFTAQDLANLFSNTAT